MHWKRTIVTCLLGCGLFLLPACTGTQDHGGHEHGDHGVAYVCPMHPEVTGEGPGSCRICGMDLVEKSE